MALNYANLAADLTARNYSSGSDPQATATAMNAASATTATTATNPDSGGTIAAAGWATGSTATLTDKALTGDGILASVQQSDANLYAILMAGN